jgi:hypothetical protein
MAYVPRTAFTGKAAINLEAYRWLLYELPHGAKQRLKHTQPGYDAVEHELETALPQHAEALGIAPKALQSLKECSAQIADLQQAYVELSRLCAVVHQSLLLLQDMREAKIAGIAKTVKSASKRLDPAVLGSFKETIKYHGQVGDKAAATRRKNTRAKVA